MADIHAESFDKSWPALDMAVHVARDLCLGTGEPLASFAVIRRSDVDAEVLTVATRPDARGRGLAGEVLQAVADRLREDGLRDLFLEVAEDNAPARALYARLGFQPIGRRPGYYTRPGGRMAAITYSLVLAR
jgi:ribosomal-protein-alanine N-acetyltransferase